MPPEACSDCGALLSAGARFCHRCGTPVGAAPRRAPAAEGAPSNAIPWAVASIALVALIALLASQNFKSRTATGLDAPLNALPQPELGDAGGMSSVRGPDISALTPRQRADRLFDRVMRYHEAGNRDSLQFFAAMGIRAYQMVTPLDADARYDMGRIAEVAGFSEIARAQADTILRRSPTHLLGLILAMRTAPTGSDADGFRRRLLSAAPAERRRNLPEYQRHEADIQAALGTSGSGGRDD